MDGEKEGSDAQEKEQGQYQKGHMAIVADMQGTDANATSQLLFGSCLMSLENDPTSKVL